VVIIVVIVVNTIIIVVGVVIIIVIILVRYEMPVCQGSKMQITIRRGKDCVCMLLFV